jgi:hypothetical protein
VPYGVVAKTLILFSPAFALCACATMRMEEVVRERASNDFHCQEEHLKVAEVGGNSYRVKGCGYATVYDCVLSGPYSEPTCVPEDRPER